MSRPLSPHLQIYRPQITSGLSVFHRFTGAVATMGLLCMVLWLVLLMGGEPAYSWYSAILRSVVGKLFLFIWSFCLFYHLCNGIRHMVWDTGRGFEKTTYLRSGQLVITVSAVLTLLLWFSF